MMPVAKIALLFASVWAILLFAVKILIAVAGRRRLYSRRQGSALAGIFYNFTGAMLPSKKESLSKHKLSFTIGVIFHVGIFAAVLIVIFTVIRPDLAKQAKHVLIPLIAASLAAGVFLFIKRIFLRNMRAMSAPEDYFAIFAACGFVFLALLNLLLRGDAVLTVTWFYAAGLLVYMPLGKLRHAVTFFIVRAEFGARLGRRGTYPPKKAEETCNAG